MAEQETGLTPEQKAAQKAEKNAQAGKKKRVMTFVYSSENDTEVKLGRHKSTEASVDLAWKEFCEKHKLLNATRFGTAIPGMVEWMPEKLRSMSKDEMEKLLKENKLI